MSEKKFLGYICFSKPKSERPITELMISNEISQIEEWKQEDRNTRKRRTSTERGDDKSISTDGQAAPINDKLKSLMQRFRKAISGYQVLADSSMGLLPATKFLHISKEMYPEAKKSLEVFKEDAEHVIFGITPSLMPMIKRHTSRLEEIDHAITVLPGAILLSLVATFDSLIVDIITTMLASRPDRISKSEKKFSVAQILSMSSFEEVRARVVSDEVSSVMRGSHKEQIEFIEQSFNIKFPRNHDHWGNFIEIFERRNLVAHGDLYVNHIYIENCKHVGLDLSGKPVGKRLTLSREYLSKSSDILAEVGIEIMHSYGSKIFQMTWKRLIIPLTIYASSFSKVIAQA